MLYLVVQVQSSSLVEPTQKLLINKYPNLTFITYHKRQRTIIFKYNSAVTNDILFEIRDNENVIATAIDDAECLTNGWFMF